MNTVAQWLALLCVGAGFQSDQYVHGISMYVLPVFLWIFLPHNEKMVIVGQ